MSGANCPGDVWGQKNVEMEECRWGNVGIPLQNYKSTLSGYNMCHPDSHTDRYTNTQADSF